MEPRRQAANDLALRKYVGKKHLLIRNAIGFQLFHSRLGLLLAIENARCRNKRAIDFHIWPVGPVEKRRFMVMFKNIHGNRVRRSLIAGINPNRPEAFLMNKKRACQITRLHANESEARGVRAVILHAIVEIGRTCAFHQVIKRALLCSGGFLLSLFAGSFFLGGLSFPSRASAVSMKFQSTPP